MLCWSSLLVPRFLFGPKGCESGAGMLLGAATLANSLKCFLHFKEYANTAHYRIKKNHSEKCPLFGAKILKRRIAFVYPGLESHCWTRGL